MRALGTIDKRWKIQAKNEIVILDNRDSFVYNLAHRFAELGVDVAVERSDSVSLQTLISWQPRALIVSPGPGHPADAGISVSAIEHFSGKIPILGVCLGHQAIGHAFGAHVEPNGAPMHGKPSMVTHVGCDLFEGVSQPFTAGRYHSLVVREPLPDVLVPVAWYEDFVMGLRHRDHPTYGVQFHPESVLTPQGCQLLNNFVRHI